MVPLSPVPKEKPKVWCVRQKDGWCMMADQNADSPDKKDEVSNVPTKCGYVVVVPLGVEHRMPTCGECISEM